MGPALKLLRTVQLAMLASILLYAGLGEVVGPLLRPVDPALGYVFSFVAVGLVGMIFVVRRTLVFRSAENLASHPDSSITLSHWKTGYFATYALCEALGLFGIALRLLGFSRWHSLPFYLSAFVLIAFFGPRDPVHS